MLICAECVMRRRLTSIEKTGEEPPLDARVTDGLPPLRPAQTVVQGTALCAQHLVECVQIQRQSAIVAPNGSNYVIPAGQNGACG